MQKPCHGFVMAPLFATPRHPGRMLLNRRRPGCGSMPQLRLPAPASSMPASPGRLLTPTSLSWMPMRRSCAWRPTATSPLRREMASNGSPAPEFESDEDRASYLVRLPVHPKAPSTPTQSGAQSGAQSLLSALKEMDLSASELVVALSLKSKTGAIKRTLNDLLQEGLIEYTIPDKPTGRLQKYRLTEKGRALLENQ